MQGSQTITEGPQFEQARYSATVIPQTDYARKEFSIKLDGIDQVNGNAHYVVLVKKPTGESTTEYYDVNTNLLTKSVESVEAQGQQMTITTEYKDYEKVNGVMIPSTIEMIGMMPTPMILKKEKIEINTGVDDSVFQE